MENTQSFDFPPIKYVILLLFIKLYLQGRSHNSEMQRQSNLLVSAFNSCTALSVIDNLYFLLTKTLIILL